MTVSNELIDSLLADYKKPEDLIGEYGILKELTKRLVERALEVELAEHLGHGRHELVANPTGNARNCKSKKTLSYASNNAPKKVNVLGSFLLSILAGHTRYAHITSLMGDGVNSTLLDMTKVISDDSARRVLAKIEEEDGGHWLQDHLYRCYSPLISHAWILDTNVTVKPLYGKQEGAVIGYNSHKPGRPSHSVAAKRVVALKTKCLLLQPCRSTITITLFVSN